MDERAAREMNMVDRLQQIAHEEAGKKGWNQGTAERSFGDWCTLITTEISEAYEDYREHRELNEIYFEYRGNKYTPDEMEKAIRYDGVAREECKPCGIPIEFADAVIRILHFAGYAGFNLYNMIEMKMDYNRRRTFRHGGKKV